MLKMKSAVRCNKNTKSESYSQSVLNDPVTIDAVRCNKNTKSESYSQLARKRLEQVKSCALQQKY